MRNKLLVLLAIIGLFVVSYSVRADYTEPEIINLFNTYGYQHDDADLKWWSKNDFTKFGNLEENLQRRFAQDHPYMTVERGFLLVSEGDDLEFGATAGVTPFRPSEFKTTLGESKTEGHSDTTLKLTSITTKDDNTLSATILGDTIVLSINPTGSNSEIVLCTGLTVSTKTFTGCTFGQRFDRSGTQSGNIKAHAPGEVVTISNTDTFLTAQFSTLDGDNTFFGTQEISTTTGAGIIRFFFGEDRSAYFFHSTRTGAFGWSTTTEGSGEFLFGQGASNFTEIDPLQLVAGVLRLNTSTNDFDLNGSNQLTIRKNNSITSNVDGLAVNTTTAFNWTGLHDFKATTTLATTTIKGATTFNGTATSTVGFDSPQYCISGANCVTAFANSKFLVGTTTSQTIADTTSEIFFGGGGDIVVIPGGTFGTTGGIKVVIPISTYSDAGADNILTIDVKYGGSDICNVSLAIAPIAGKVGILDIYIFANGSESAQICIAHIMQITEASTGNEMRVVNDTSSVDTSVSGGITISGQWNGNTGAQVETFTHNSIIITNLGK